jgi:hypothetical protein
MKRAGAALQLLYSVFCAPITLCLKKKQRIYICYTDPYLSHTGTIHVLNHALPYRLARLRARTPELQHLCPTIDCAELSHPIPPRSPGPSFADLLRAACWLTAATAAGATGLRAECALPRACTYAALPNSCIAAQFVTSELMKLLSICA